MRSDAYAPARWRVRIEHGRLFANVYLALALWRACRLDEFAAAHLSGGKEDVPWEKMAAVLVAARLGEPSSELHIAEDWYRRTALRELPQLHDARVNKDRLYRALDHLLPHKAALEAHLSRRVGELSAVNNEVRLRLKDRSSPHSPERALQIARRIPYHEVSLKERPWAAGITTLSPEQQELFAAVGLPPSNKDAR